MKNPKIKTKVVHSKTKQAWNIVGTILDDSYKIARVPYVVSASIEVSISSRNEAYERAKFISACFNNSDKIMEIL